MEDVYECCMHIISTLPLKKSTLSLLLSVDWGPLQQLRAWPHQGVEMDTARASVDVHQIYGCFQK